MAQIKSAPGGQLTTLNNQLAMHVDDGADSDISKWIDYGTLKSDIQDINSLTEKTILVDNDELLINDSEDSNSPKKIKIQSIPIIKTNDIIDGALDTWLAGNTSITGVTTGTYMSDFLKYTFTGTAVIDSARESTTVPLHPTTNEKLFNYALKITPTTADVALGASDEYRIVTYIEGYNVKKYIQNGYFTFSFWIRNFKTGTFCVSIRNSGNDRSYVKEETINASDTYEKKIVTFPMNFTGGTWDFTNGLGLIITICLGSGSTYQTTKDSWQNSLYFATANQDNFLDSTSNVCYIAGFSCGAGTQEIGFDGYDYKRSLEDLQWFYKKISPPYVQSGLLSSIIGYATATSLVRFSMNVGRSMRTHPAISFDSTPINFINISASSYVSVSLSSISNITMNPGGNLSFFWNDTATPFVVNNVYSPVFFGDSIILDARF